MFPLNQLGLYVAFLLFEGLVLLLSRRQQNTDEISHVDKPATQSVLSA